MVVTVSAEQADEKDIPLASPSAVLHAQSMPQAAIAIAYSGGLDSSVLLQVAKNYADRHGILLYAFHIHHGISPNADAWLALRLPQQRRDMQFRIARRG